MSQDPSTLAGRINVFLGRQPILDRNQELFAFELLYRSGAHNAAVFDDDVKATSIVIINAFNELGVDSVLGRYRGFINLIEPMLMSDVIEVLPKDKVVLEVLETTRPTPAVAARCMQLKDMGFSLALDDVVSADAAFEPLLPAIEFIKIDVQQTAPGSLSGLARQFKDRGFVLVAEKVDSRAQADECLGTGFDYFQGYYFARPDIIVSKRLAPAEATLIDLLGLVLTDADQSTIEETLKRDAALSVNLLRLANSAASGLRRHVTTIGSAVILLGRRQLQRWVLLLLYASEPSRSVPTPLMQLAATRGRLMELLAPYALEPGARDLAFITGIMSLMDALLRRPLSEIVALLPVPPEVSSALLERGGRLGALLKLCEELEEGDPARIAAALTTLSGLSAQIVNLAQADALRWANAIGEQKN